MLVMTDGKSGETYNPSAIYDFQDRLRQIRNNLKLSQKAMARIMGVSLRTMQRYEDGTCFPDAPALIRLCPYGVDLHFLIAGSSIENPALTQVKPGVVYFAFRSDRFKQIEETLQQAGMTTADLYFVMDHHLRGIVDGLKYLNEKPL